MQLIPSASSRLRRRGQRPLISFGLRNGLGVRFCQGTRFTLVSSEAKQNKQNRMGHQPCQIGPPPKKGKLHAQLGCGTDVPDSSSVQRKSLWHHVCCCIHSG